MSDDPEFPPLIGATVQTITERMRAMRAYDNDTSGMVYAEVRLYGESFLVQVQNVEYGEGNRLVLILDKTSWP